MPLTVRIKKKYGDFCLDVDFSAEAGETLALLGASGCGKSTTLKCIAGIHRPDWGRVELDGRVLFDSEAHIDLPPQKRRVGYLFQQYALFPNMTVEQNITAALGHLDRSRRRERVRELTALLRLGGTEGLRPGQLSGGQQQRTALARILAAEPQAILLDEPLAALDSFLRGQLEPELRDVLARFGGPAVWVSHDRGEVYRNCSRVCVLASGKSAPACGVKELMTAPGTVSAARLSGCGNYVPVRPGLRPGTVEVPSWGLTLEAAAPWREGITTLGIRERHVCPAGKEMSNAFFCRTVRVTEDISSMLIDLRPEDAEEDTPLLRMELDKDVWAALPDRENIWVKVQAEALLLLED
ncbi:MAG: ATP-binding cassette domain-containing protein [Oscillospiraceae bacterium]|nr:ATP-binding cassette domain-containing protein [Oscillospiraceae bacterium]